MAHTYTFLHTHPLHLHARSMYFDEDGDLAHEFYQEERVVNSAGVVRWAMRRVFDNLTPQVTGAHTHQLSRVSSVSHQLLLKCISFLLFPVAMHEPHSAPPPPPCTYIIQGQVDYVYPRLHTNLPVVLIETVAMHAVQTNL